MAITNERDGERKRVGPQFLFSSYYFLKSFFGYSVYTIKTRDKKWNNK